MLITIMGESCVGKSTLANVLKTQLNAEIYTGKDYLRLAKSEAIAKILFEKKLRSAVTGENLIWVISEREFLPMIPEGAVRVLVTADLERILERFTARMHGQLPDPVRRMLERKHGCFDREACHFHIHNNENTQQVMQEILCLKK